IQTGDMFGRYFDNGHGLTPSVVAKSLATELVANTEANAGVLTHESMKARNMSSLTNAQQLIEQAATNGYNRRGRFKKDRNTVIFDLLQQPGIDWGKIDTKHELTGLSSNNREAVE